MKDLINTYIGRAFPLVSHSNDATVKRNIAIDSVWISAIAFVLTA